MSSRPLSPHLQIYRPQLTSILSITHRTTGIFLSAGLLALGIRHLFWDVGMGFELKTVYASGYTVVVASVVMTALTWSYVLSQGSVQ